MVLNAGIATICLAAILVIAVITSASKESATRPIVTSGGSAPSLVRSPVMPSASANAPAGEVGDLKPRTLAGLLAIPKEDLGRVDLLRMNLLCAEGLPGSEQIDIEAYSARLDTFAVAALADTNRHLYRVTDPRYADHYRGSETYLRGEFLAQTLVEKFGMRYNMERFWNPDFSDSRDQFLHGLIDPEHPGGTCVSIPTLMAAAGRRLGYPMKLALAREHVFARWDGPGDNGAPMRLNMETSGGGFDSFVDDYYRLGPSKPISDKDMEHREFLVSLTPAEELAIFLAARGHCLYDNGHIEQALEAYELAVRYAPSFTAHDSFVRRTRATLDGTLSEFVAAEIPGRVPEARQLSTEGASAYLWRPE